MISFVCVLNFLTSLNNKITLKAWAEKAHDSTCCVSRNVTCLLWIYAYVIPFIYIDMFVFENFFYIRINVESVSMCVIVYVQALAVLSSKKRIGCMNLWNFLHDVLRRLKRMASKLKLSTEVIILRDCVQNK